MAQTQVCRTCNQEKPFTEFSYRNDNRKYRPDCKPCRSDESAARRYGIELGEVMELKDQQGNRCAICKTHADDVPHRTFSHNPLVIDHNHETGRVRGLLCPTCNTGLGQFQDSIGNLLDAVEYLRKDEDIV